MADWEDDRRAPNGAAEWDREDVRMQNRSASPSSRRSPPRRERSPRASRRERSPGRNGHASSTQNDDAPNTGTNLFVTGIASRMDEQELEEMFSKYGKVEKCQIMCDPHTKESRGFGFVCMATPAEADSAREGITGEERYGRVLSVEKAKRGRPRTPTPGCYHGPCKQQYGAPRRGYRGEPRRFDRGYDRYDRGHDRYDRRDRYDDRRGYDRYDRYEDRRGGYDDRDRSYSSYSRYDRDDRGGYYDRR